MTLPPFQQLLDSYGRDVHRFLRASVGQLDADDVYQETWLSALRAYPQLKDASNLRGWVFTVAHRKVIDHSRSRRRRPIPVDQLPEAATHPSPWPDDELWSEVARLPAKQRTSLALRYVVDASYADIASAMGTSTEAARRSVHEAVKRLREELSQ
ncbi:MAG: sigma-70 family RNA polymerase sigma factor [Solirubrobacterales bacterium]|nr:sigma-70 family RNA polymerase sigma factor [Solirubrobacterales bacterium]